MSLSTRTTPRSGRATPATGGPAATAVSAGSVPLSSPTGLGALAALQSVLGSLLTVVAPVVGIWIAATHTGADWVDTLRVAADAWLLAHGASIAVTGGALGIVPLGLTAVPAAWCWAGGRRLAIALGLTAGTAAPGHRGRWALSAFALTYGLACGAVALVAASPAARPSAVQAVLGGVVLATTVTGAAMLRAARSPSRPRPVGAFLDRFSLPVAVRRLVPAAGVALAVWLTTAALVVTVALLLGWETVMAAHDALRPGPVGGLGLALAQVVLLPTAVVWAGAWLAGPGFAVGTGTAVTPWTAQLGSVPALPLLGALPDGPLPEVLPAVLVAPVLAGVVAGTWLARRPARSALRWWRPLADSLGCGLLAGAGAGVLAWLSSGPAGPGRLAEVGPQWWPVTVSVTVLVAVGCAVASVLAVLLRSDRARRLRAAVQPSSRLPGVPSWLRSRSQRS